jgi:hypothetical protein
MTKRATNPYRLLPECTRWAKAVGSLPYSKMDPVVGFPFEISRTEKVATGGSCFAQHIARYMKKDGFNYYVAESIHPISKFCPDLEKRFNYGTFSARYGNIYTSRQLLQLFKRAYGEFAPKEMAWRDARGKVLDPFRPAIQPDGFISEQEMLRDRAQHFSCVRKMFENCDVFVFTLGLTEFWHCLADGAVLPVCPGVAGGEFDDARYAFGNLTVGEVVAELNEFFDRLNAVNPNVKVVLTVSPVPLAATALPRHVLVSTTYSKSVLRVAAEMVCAQRRNVGYFPSYEIIVGNYNRGRYYSEDLREVTEEGVSHVMRLFMKHVARIEGEAPERPGESDQESDLYARMQKFAETVCEEALIESSLNEDRAEG